MAQKKHGNKVTILENTVAKWRQGGKQIEMAHATNGIAPGEKTPKGGDKGSKTRPYKKMNLKWKIGPPPIALNLTIALLELVREASKKC